MHEIFEVEFMEKVAFWMHILHQYINKYYFLQQGTCIIKYSYNLTECLILCRDLNNKIK